MNNLRARKAFILYKLLSVALDLRTFGRGEIESLTGITLAEVDEFIDRNLERGFLRAEKSGRVSISPHAFEILAAEAVSSSREVLRAVVRRMKSEKRVAPERRIEQVWNRSTGHFRDTLLIAARTEALLQGARPKINVGRAKASRIAMEEFRLGILSEEDLRVVEKVEAPLEDYSYLDYSAEEFIDSESGASAIMRLPLLGNE